VDGDLNRNNLGEEFPMDKDKINLLIVDDEEPFLESMKKRLEVRGFAVTCVNRGDKAIEAARKHPVDIALVDLKMPGISGEETLEALKKEHEWMEVVILTGHGSVDSAVKCTRGGAYSYLQKPCELDLLLEVLKDAYKKRIMNKMQIQEAQMNALLQKARGDSPLAILRRLKEMETGAA
jgi:DNA-binding NtrC family response regulator